MDREQENRLLRQTGEPASLVCVFGRQSIGNLPVERVRHPSHTHIRPNSGFCSPGKIPFLLGNQKGLET